MTRKDFYIPSSDRKTQLHCVAWTPDTPPRAVVQMLHGISSHIGRFAGLAEFFCARGIAFVGNDHLGHGESVKSQEDRLLFAETGGWEFVLRDLRVLNGWIHGQFPGVPVMMLGHSMGSFLARCYVIRFHGEVDALLLSGTLHKPYSVIRSGLALAKGEILRKGLRCRSTALQSAMFGAYNRGISPKRSPYDWLSRDPEVVERYMADPLCGGEASAGLIRDMLGGIAYMLRPENIRRMDKGLPVLFFSGMEDPVGDYGAGVYRAYAAFVKAGMEDVSLKLYPGGRHEMLNELNRDQVRQDILDWMETKLRQGPSLPEDGIFQGEGQGV